MGGSGCGSGRLAYGDVVGFGFGVAAVGVADGEGDGVAAGLGVFMDGVLLVG